MMRTVHVKVWIDVPDEPDSVDISPSELETAIQLAIFRSRIPAAIEINKIHVEADMDYQCDQPRASWCSIRQ